MTRKFLVRPAIRLMFKLIAKRLRTFFDHHVLFLEKNQAINYAKNRASFRSGEIRILDSSSDLERTIPFSEAHRKL